MPSTKLYIGKIPENHDAHELKQHFEKYGRVVEFDILKDFGFVHYEIESEAKSAVDALDGLNHRGQNITVEMSRSTVRQKPGMGGKGECYRCGGEGHWSKECPKGPTRGRGRGVGGRGGYGRGGMGDRNDDFRRGGFGDPYGFRDPYDFYPRRPLPPHPYERLRYDPYERRAPPAMPPRDYYSMRNSPDYYRRSPPLPRDPPPPRDPYYDYYLKRRYDAMDRYGDALDRTSSTRGSLPAHPIKDEMKSPLIRSSMGGRIPGRVPGPY